MRSSILGAVSISAAMLAAALILSNATLAQTPAAESDSSSKTIPVYDPYPPGILPSNLNSELARVAREVDVIEARALARWQALAPPVLTGQPPTLQGTGTASIEVVGELMNFDRNISPFKDIACASCHMPYAGFSGPIPSVNLTMIAYPGTFHFRAGKRTAQRYTYAPFFPVLQYNQVQGAFFGGNFWDSRATGYLLRKLTRNRHSIRPSTPRKWAIPIRLASRSSFRRPNIGRSSRKSGEGAPSTSTFRR